MGVSFFCWDLRIGVRVCLWEVSVYRRLFIQSFLKEMAGTSDWCPLTGGVRLREVSASGSSTVVSQPVGLSFNQSFGRSVGRSVGKVTKCNSQILSYIFFSFIMRIEIHLLFTGSKTAVD